MVVTEKDCNGVENLSERLSVNDKTTGIQLCSMESQDEGAVVETEAKSAKVVDGSKANKDDVGLTGLDSKITISDIDIVRESPCSVDEAIILRVEGVDQGELGSVERKNKDENSGGEHSSGVATEEEIGEYNNVSWNVPVDLESGIVVFVTSCPGNAKVKSDTRRVLHLLNVKKVEYETVDLANNGVLRIHMLERSDLNITIPQVHVNGVFIGTAEDLQESEDFGELDDLLRGVEPEIVKENTRVKIEERIKAIETGGSILGEVDLSGIKESKGNTCIQERIGTGLQLEEDCEIDCSLGQSDFCPSQKSRVERKVANHHVYFQASEQTDSIGSAVGIIKAKKE